MKNRFGAHKPTWFLVSFVMHIFVNPGLIQCCLIIIWLFTKVALTLLVYVCQLYRCFGSSHCRPLGNLTFVDFIWVVGSPSGSLGFVYIIGCLVRAVGHWVTCPLLNWLKHWSWGKLALILLTTFTNFMFYIDSIFPENVCRGAIKTAGKHWNYQHLFTP